MHAGEQCECVCVAFLNTPPTKCPHPNITYECIPQDWRRKDVVFVLGQMCGVYVDDVELPRNAQVASMNAIGPTRPFVFLFAFRFFSDRLVNSLAAEHSVVRQPPEHCRGCADSKLSSGRHRGSARSRGASVLRQCAQVQLCGTARSEEPRPPPAAVHAPPTGMGKIENDDVLYVGRTICECGRR